jgi:hypothetical protein
MFLHWPAVTELLKLRIVQTFLLLRQSKNIWWLSSFWSLHNAHTIGQFTPLLWRLIRVGIHRRHICHNVLDPRENF